MDISAIWCKHTQKQNKPQNFAVCSAKRKRLQSRIIGRILYYMLHDKRLKFLGVAKHSSSALLFNIFAQFDRKILNLFPMFDAPHPLTMEGCGRSKMQITLATTLCIFVVAIDIRAVGMGNYHKRPIVESTHCSTTILAIIAIYLQRRKISLKCLVTYSVMCVHPNTL